MSKPRWVECADEATQVLKAARSEDDVSKKDAVVREAHAWMTLGRLYREEDPTKEPSL